jgi:hypothetical protein
MSLALSQDDLEVIRLLCDVTLRIVEGEIYQLTKNGVVDSDRRRALRHRSPEDGVPVRGQRQDRRHARADDA